MKKQKNKFVKLIVVGLLTITFNNSKELFALDKNYKGADIEKKQELMIGAGGIMVPKYIGSDKTRFEPFPFIEVNYETNFGSLFINIEDGAGISFEPFGSIPLNISAGIGIETVSRDNDDDMKLKGTPNLKNSCNFFGAVKYDMYFGTISGKIKYFPVSSEYDSNIIKDKDYDSLIFSLDLENQYEFNDKIMINLRGGVSWMNDDYANANYSVDYKTDYLPLYKAESGLNDLHTEAELIYMLRDHLGIGLICEINYLIKDASDSPLTESDLQPFCGAFVFYSF